MFHFFLQVPVPPQVPTPESLATYVIYILVLAVVGLFTLIVAGGKVFWKWIQEQFEYLKGEIESLQDEVKVERETRTKELKQEREDRMRELKEIFYSSIATKKDSSTSLPVQDDKQV